uniref:Uncharacterized protein n=1 Tax=Lepeophtheirus salmonis TaxID=72036 RepID=A0A0K2TIQ1_LEPSM
MLVFISFICFTSGEILNFLSISIVLPNENGVVGVFGEPWKFRF